MSHIYRQMARELAGYTLPTSVLPLARSRQPFAEIAPEAVADLITLVHQHAGKTGRLTTAIREQCPALPDPPMEGTVIEAHLDCVALPPDILSRVVSLGFEPDHFVEFVPDCYPDHFTFKVVGEKNQSTLFQVVASASERLIDVLRGHAGFQGYLELEVYKTDWRTIIPFRPYSGATLPLEIEALRPIEDHAGCKQADIHVKTPTPARGLSPELTDGPTMTLLRQSLLNAGFYPVLTEAGNRVYTAQFADRTECRRVYDLLAHHFIEHGGIVDIVFEPCLFFWKSHPETPIPPIVRLH